MFCPNCGTKLEDNALFCTSCGVRIQTEAPADEPAAAQAQPLPNTGFASATEQTDSGWQQTQANAYEQPSSAPQPPYPIKDYLTTNIVLTVVSVFSCCFDCFGIVSLITGIIGIVFSTKVRTAIAAGDWTTAEQKSRTAKTMWIVTAIILGISILFGVILMVLGTSQQFIQMLEDMMY